MGDDRVSSHRLFLIRHGETLDNVANLYGGVRDSPLTNHGFQQATRLGEYFAKSQLIFTHVFSSDLSRAFKTAETIRTWQPPPDPGVPTVTASQTVALKELREFDFGYYEGKSYHVHQPSSSDKDIPGFQDIESHEAVAVRANAFIDGHLFPLLNGAASGQHLCIAVISHGMLLSTLWRCIVRRQPSETVALTPELLATRSFLSLENLGSWANTGYLEAELNGLRRAPPAIMTHSVSVDDRPAFAAQAQTDGENSTRREEDGATYGDAPKKAPMSLSTIEPLSESQFSILIKTINCRDHLDGLKRTRGGVGSSKYDEGQKSIKSFFTRPKPN